MQLDHHLAQVAQQLSAAAALGDDRTREIADALAAAAAPAMRLAVLNALAEAADEITAVLLDLPGSPTVTVRLDGDEVAVEVRLADTPREPAGERGRDDGEANARISLRLSEALKADVDAAADRDGISVNTWLVRAADGGPRTEPVRRARRVRQELRRGHGRHGRSRRRVAAGRRTPAARGRPAHHRMDQRLRRPPTMPVHTFPLTGPINLLVRIGHGAVTVDARDDLEQASVELTGADGDTAELDQIVVVKQGPTLTVAAPRQGGIFDLGFLGARRGKGGVDVRVVVPSGTAVKISTVTADITLTGRVAGADLAFGSASAAADHVDGDLRLRFGNGSVHVARVAGSVQLRSGSGSARFGEVAGDLRAGCGSGDLTVEVARGAVSSRCGSGLARLAEVYGDVDFVSGAGGLEIGLPAGVTARLDVTTGSGRVRSELPIEDEPRSAAGAITVRARTGNGDVRLFRAA